MEFNLAFARELVQDLDEAQMTICPGPGLENHPAFTLGHLVTAIALMNKYLDGDYQLPDGWEELFKRNGPGDPRKPEENKDAYPDKRTLLDELERQHEMLYATLDQYPEEAFAGAKEWRFSTYMPTQLDTSIFMLVNHSGMHLGQLSAWRRAMGLPSALGRM